MLLLAFGAGARTAVGASGAAITPPPAGVAWQYQLQPSSSPALAATGGIDLSLCARAADNACVRPSVYDIDLYGPDGTTPNARAVGAIVRAGGYPICYVDAGTWESWRPDARRYPAALLGASNGWPGERWLDIRHPASLLRIIAARVAACRRAGFRAVEFDNVDAYTNHTGFPLTAAEQLRFDVALARLAHRDLLAAGLKNDYGQVGELARHFDFAIDEQCVRYAECARLRPFVAAGKPVYDVEYSSQPAAICPTTARSGIQAIRKSLALHARPWEPCAPLHPDPGPTVRSER